MKNLLLIGKTPPPIGGVTIHVQRLKQSLEIEGFNFSFLNLTVFNLLILPFTFLNYKLVHLHTSSLVIQDYVSLLCKFMRVKCIITFHGDLERFDAANSKKVKLIIKRVTIPIVLNEGSYEIASSLNQNSRLISSFLPPVIDEMLPHNTLRDISNLRTIYSTIYSTNAYGLTIDKNGDEIYGIIDLISYFNKLNNKSALIISDPSSEYINYIKKEGIVLKENILVINNKHSFVEVLKLSDASIRNTSTDGDSLSIKESLFLDKVTFATNVVSRPIGTIEYERGKYNFDIPNINVAHNVELSAKKELIEIYNNFL